MVLLVDAATLALLGGIVVVLGVAVQRGNYAAVVNAVVSLAAALLPVALASGLDLWYGLTVHVPPALTLWIAVAGLLHSIGMLGPYDSVWWYDHLTHLVSVALVTALLYAGLLALALQPGGFEAGRVTIGVLAVVLAMLAGVFWELIELVAKEVGERIDIEPILVHYGWRDTALDLLFDLVGAVLVVALDVRSFVGLAEASIQATRVLLVASGSLFLLGSVAMAAFVRFGRGG